MTLTEIEANLPNGFHDAEIEELIWNYRADSASFTMKLWVPEATDRDIEIYRLGRLDVRDIVFMAIDPPHPRDLDPKSYKPVWGIADRWSGNDGNNISRPVET
jgi:hypothetical protein